LLEGEQRRKGGRICSMYFIYLHENKTMKLVENFSEGGKGLGRMMDGLNLTKVYCKHICKCHNGSPLSPYHECMLSYIAIFC
jgi:hypothetical protein